MKVKELMSHPVVTCPSTATLNHAARLMWEFDCGIIPVVNDEGQLAGVVTDRDICMAAYTQGAKLDAIRVTLPMATDVVALHADDDIDNAETLIRASKVHRLPVIDEFRRPVGVLSMNDLARATNRAHASSRDREFVQTMAALCEPRHAAAALLASPPQPVITP